MSSTCYYNTSNCHGYLQSSQSKYYILKLLLEAYGIISKELWYDEFL